MEERLDIFDEIERNMSHLQEHLTEENLTSEDIKWIISDIHVLLDDLLETTMKK